MNGAIIGELDYPGVKESSGLLPIKCGSFTVGNFKNDKFCETDSLLKG